jgi:hypothetical protein
VRLDAAWKLLYKSVELGEESVSIGKKMLEKQGFERLERTIGIIKAKLGWCRYSRRQEMSILESFSIPITVPSLYKIAFSEIIFIKPSANPITSCAFSAVNNAFGLYLASFLSFKASFNLRPISGATSFVFTYN